MSTTASPAAAARDELTGFGGELIGPDDTTYDEARALYNAMIDKRPALISRPAVSQDVAAVVRFAREHDLAIAIRGGGHNGAGLACVDDGVVIDLSRLKTISVDPSSGSVRVGGGSVWGEVDAVTHEHGLAVPSGVVSTTGVGGLTLGGGSGHLTRQYGLTIDNLLSAEVVLADGRIVTASTDEESDLFWALRGGGGNFGVVTEFAFRAGPSRPSWAARRSGRSRTPTPCYPPTASGFPRLRGTSRRSSPSTQSRPAPPFPEEIHLRKVCGIVWCVDASDEDAEKAMAPMLEVAEPLMHGVGRMPLKDLNGAFDGLYGPGDQWYWRGDFFDEIADEAIVRNREWNEKMPTWKSGSHLYPVDGAAQDVRVEDTAYAYRNATWSQVIIAVDPDPAGAGAIRDWAIGYWEALHPYSAGGAYVNFMMEEGQARVKATYGPNYDRLARVKTAYDPDNVFHVNQNIVPAA